MALSILTANKSALAEGPLWHPEHQVVYWTDIESGTLYSYDPEEETTKVVHIGTKIGGFTVQEDGSLLLFREAGKIDVLSKEGVVTFLEEIADERETRFNDVAADPLGRVFCGVMPTSTRPGRLYLLETNGTLSIVLEGVGCSNGMGWSPDRKTMYHTDSAARTISAFDFDPESGAMEGQRTFYKHEGQGVPDGMTVDREGNVWTGIWDGGCLIQLDPQGAEIQRIELPARKITCPTFGGPDYAHLYVTTAGGHLLEDGEGAGELIKIDAGIKGVPEFRSRIEVIQK